MALIKFDPFESLNEIQSEIDRIFNRRVPAKTNREASLSTSDWYPAVDIHEDSEGFYFDVEAPGVTKDQFKVNLENGMLTVRGERKNETEKKEKNYHRIERSYGTFSRAFSLPEIADTEKVNAEYKDGVLKIKVGKKEIAKPKQVEVKVA